MEGVVVRSPEVADVAVPAVALAAVLAAACFVARQHRRYGRVGGWSGGVGAAVVATGCGLLAFAVWPLPDGAGPGCAAGGTPPAGGIGGTLLPPNGAALARAAMTTAVFLPVGLLARHRYRSGWARAAALGLALAAGVQAVQLIGLLGPAPCAHWVAALDDVLLAGLGTLLGWSVAAALGRRLPRGWPAAVPDLLPPSLARRTAGHALDLALCWTGAAALAALLGAVPAIPPDAAATAHPAVFAGLLAALGLVVPLLRRDRCTPGRAAVHVAISGTGPPRPAARRRVLARTLPFYLPIAALAALDLAWWSLAVLLPHVCCAVLRRDQAGLLDLLAGTRVVTRTMAVGGGLPRAMVRHIPPRPPDGSARPAPAGRTG
ncbi:RDD family protein [Marinitenerispora sediminis]|uniref:Uncharacterized protein n=1 Tax=Marinitenerispora sediminis TaxID=1931232 RepID=A0A368TAK3_9ACTN|nr:RDD family protein [Marinitenerispora sediminis]RCV55879.1 hypothetical protein DEF28_04830 [Marinitenerispora sediminis]RCV61998.1 hypothetical protein DEF24_02910 [Marinitenerispora sediminis]RCV62009.1 hypothetical protein DEF23_00580 [Marinitenerispora sediminis]